MGDLQLVEQRLMAQEKLRMALQVLHHLFFA